MSLPQRKKIRLPDYDYAKSNAYFITICTDGRACLLGEIAEQEPFSFRPSLIGEVVQQEIENIPEHFRGVSVDKYVIMPNHVHLILILNREQEQNYFPTVGDIICAMKSISAKAANKADDEPGRKIWQYRFHDHIIRNAQDYQKIWQYIDENPLKWQNDCFFEE